MNKIFFLSAVSIFILASCANKSQNIFTKASPAPSNIYQLKELNTVKIQSFDKNKTVVIIPGGIMEEHGPYLPVFTDGYWNEKLTDTIAKAIAATPGWSVIIFPTIPLGNSGANDIGGKYSFPGSYTVRFETLRSVFMDIATELGGQGFKNIIIIHSHGAPNHQRALDEAAAFFNDTYSGKMINLMGINALQLSWFDAPNAADMAKDDGMKMHGGMSETSAMLYLMPQLVDANYKQAASFAGADMESLITIARDTSWQGYFGAPKIASAKYGEEAWNMNVRDCLKYVLDILNDKIKIDTIETFGNFMVQSKPDEMLDSLSLQEEQRRKQQQDLWLKSNGLK